MASLPLQTTPDDRIGPAPRHVGLVWTLLTINVLGFLPSDGMLVPVPKVVGQVVTMGALVLALLLALLLNPRITVRPNVYLTLLSALAVVAVASSIPLESGLGSLLRCFRFVVFVATLWLVCRWWRGDLRFVWFHVKVLGAVLLTVVAGLVSPGNAFSGPDGRLVGAIWPVPAPQVGQYCAVLIGLIATLWLVRAVDWRSAVMIIAPGFVLLLLSHTRTALVAMLVAFAFAALSTALRSLRARRALLLFGVVGGAALLFQGALLTWFQRGQDEDELLSLTGRQKVWDALLARDRTVGEQLLGVGLTDKSYGGLPIDSSWLADYHELGLIGVGLVGAMIVALLGAALLRPPTPARGCALFLVVYCCIASYTEVGLGDASPYLLHLAVAASLLITPGGGSPGPGMALLPRTREAPP
jgi:hypothetical protein